MRVVLDSFTLADCIDRARNFAPNSFPSPVES
jgi:hypothetical protein